MTIQQENSAERGRFFYAQEGRALAEMIYHWKEGRMVIEHTEVDASLTGQGVGKLLVQAAVDYVRARQQSIFPVCSYAKKVLERDPQYADVLAH